MDIHIHGFLIQMMYHLDIDKNSSDHPMFMQPFIYLEFHTLENLYHHMYLLFDYNFQYNHPSYTSMYMSSYLIMSLNLHFHLQKFIHLHIHYVCHHKLKSQFYTVNQTNKYLLDKSHYSYNLMFNIYMYNYMNFTM